MSRQFTSMTTESGSIEVRNHLDNAVYSAEKTLKEHRDKISESDAKAVEDAIAEAKKSMESGNVETMKGAQEKLLSSSHKLAEAMYKAAGAQQAPPEGSAHGAKPEAKKDDVVDAEFVDVDDKKKPGA